MMAVVLKHEKTEVYRGVTITVNRRVGGAWEDDFMYETGIGIGGAGQNSVQQALTDARRAIDARLDG